MLQKILQDTIPNPNLVLPSPTSKVKKQPTVEELLAAAANAPKKIKAK